MSFTEVILTSSRLAHNCYKPFLLLVLYVKQNSLCPHSRQNRKRSKQCFGTVKEGRQVFENSQRTITLPLQKAWRRPRNIWSRTNGEGIRKSRLRPSERTDFANCKNQVWIPHNQEAGVAPRFNAYGFDGTLSSW